MDRGQNARERILVALDTPDIDRARYLVEQLRGHVGGFKIGLELYCSHGPAFVREVRESGRVFLDLKFHDIPNTVAGAAAVAGRLGVSLFTLHAAGGRTMIRRGVEAAREAAEAAGHAPPTALAVTVLTSHDDRSLVETGMRDSCADTVSRLAGLALQAGAGGLVCSPLEVANVRRIFPEGRLVVPGVRLATGQVAEDDQARTDTPARVIERGADLLVVGRPITRSDCPVEAADAIARDIEDALPLDDGACG